MVPSVSLSVTSQRSMRPFMNVRTRPDCSDAGSSPANPGSENKAIKSSDNSGMRMIKYKKIEVQLLNNKLRPANGMITVAEQDQVHPRSQSCSWYQRFAIAGRK